MRRYAVRITTAKGQFYKGDTFNAGVFGWQQSGGSGITWLRVDRAIAQAKFVAQRLPDVFAVERVEVVGQDGRAEAVVHADGTIERVGQEPELPSPDTAVALGPAVAYNKSGLTDDQILALLPDTQRVRCLQAGKNWSFPCEFERDYLALGIFNKGYETLPEDLQRRGYTLCIREWGFGGADIYIKTKEPLA